MTSAPTDTLNPMPALGTRIPWGFKEVSLLCLPAVLTMLNATLLRFVDGMMVSKVSPDAVAAQYAAGLSSFVVDSFFFGMLGILNTFISQSLGRGKHKRCGRYAWAGIRMAGAFALLTIPMFFAAPYIMGLLKHEPATLQLETMYFRFMLMGIFLVSPVRVIEQFFYGIHKPMIVFLTALIGNAFNVGANYVLIYGKFGFPAMGLKGAAIGSLLSWGLMLAIQTFIFLRPKYHATYGTRYWKHKGKHLYGQIFRFGWPTGVQFFNSMFCWTYFTCYLIGQLGPLYFKANAIIMRFGEVTIMPIIGIGAATTAIVGRYIGAGRPDIARKRTHTAMIIALVYLVAAAALLIVFRYPMLRLFMLSEANATATNYPLDQLMTTAIQLMFLLFAFQLFDTICIIYCHALRGAGDTHFAMVAEGSLTWIFEIAGGYLMVRYFPHWGPVGPYGATAMYLLVLAVLAGWRFEKQRWKHIDMFGRRNPTIVAEEPIQSEPGI
jgi:multidrug resistance protein, MATE family